ncbi:MAG: cupin domain-containing protein [Desulfococcaceae bacterium]
MIQHIQSPARIEAAGNKPKIIEEFIGRVSSDTQEISIARMNSPEGWEEPGQCPEFDEYTVVLRGTLRIKSQSGFMDLKSGQAVIVSKHDWVQYSSPFPGGAEYIAVCLPAFSPDAVHRDS